MPPGPPDEPAPGLIEGILRRGQDATPPADDSSELLTFVIADIRGYTRFTHDHGDEAAARLTAKFAAIVRGLVTAHGGTVFELTGDEALCVFTSPRQSLRFAVGLQQRFVDETVEDVDLPLTVGIGIDIGEAVHGPDGYRGGALNLAARLCSRAKAGEVLATPEVAHLARAVDGLRYLVGDRISVKGLDDRVRPVRVLPVGEDPVKRLATALAEAAAPRPVVRWLPRPLARRPRTTAVGAALLVAAVAATAAVVVHADDSPSLSSLAENSIGIIDPGSGRIEGEVLVGAAPVAIAAGFGSVWTANADDGSVSRIDTATHLVTPIGVGSAPTAIAVGHDSVWVVVRDERKVVRIDPDTNTPLPIPVGNAPAGVAVGHGSVWVTNSGDGTVSRIDPRRNAVARTIDVGDTPRAITVDRDVWVVNSGSDSVTRIDGRTYVADAPIQVGMNPSGIAVANGLVWVSNSLSGNVSRIPIDGDAPTDAVAVGPDPGEVDAVGDDVWVVMRSTRQIAKIVSDASRLERPVTLGPVPGDLVAADGKLWVTATTNPDLHRGGTLRVAGDDLTSADPTYLQWPSQGTLLAGVYDGLVGYRHVGGADGTAIVPDLATGLPRPTNNGRTYSFRLRPGVRWSTGAPVTVADVRRGVQRAMVFANSGLGALIVGGRSCRPTRCAARGVVEDAPARTITITLVHPDADFLNLLISAVAVPADTPLAENRSHVVASTGPYVIARYVPHQLAVLTRNRFFHQWSADAQPAAFPDKIVWRMLTLKKRDRDRALAEVTAGTTDWTFAPDGVRQAELAARFHDRAKVATGIRMQGLFLNTTIPPFKDVNVRKALAYALDRGAVVNRWPVASTVTCQFLPPGTYGYRPYCPYTLHPGPDQPWTAPDVPTAEKVISRVHHRGVVTIEATNKATAIALRPVVDALRQLHYHARIKVFRGDDRGRYFEYVADSRHKVQAGFFGWVLGGARPASYFTSWTCAGYTRADINNINPGGFCDRSLDRLRRRAEHAQLTSLAAASPLWAELDRGLVKAVPWIPLANPQYTELVSSRVHNYKLNPFIGALFNLMQVR